MEILDQLRLLWRYILRFLFSLKKGHSGRLGRLFVSETYIFVSSFDYPTHGWVTTILGSLMYGNLAPLQEEIHVYYNLNGAFARFFCSFTGRYIAWKFNVYMFLVLVVAGLDSRYTLSLKDRGYSPNFFHFWWAGYSQILYSHGICQFIYMRIDMYIYIYVRWTFMYYLNATVLSTISHSWILAIPEIQKNQKNKKK